MKGDKKDNADRTVKMLDYLQANMPGGEKKDDPALTPEEEEEAARKKKEEENYKSEIPVDQASVKPRKPKPGMLV